MQTLFRSFVLSLLLLFGLTPTFTGSASAREPVPQMGTVGLADLPREAHQTLALIKAGGPFPYEKDGTRFQNREKRLPIQPSGYYTEYTVRTPGEKTRGARRIVAGGDPRTSGEYYYTDDHYDSFRRIIESPTGAAR
jgi:ribonuclease T1